MTFIVRMALREIRASWQRLLFFFVCIAVGVASIIAIRSVIRSVRVALSGEARALLASDALVTSNRPWTEHVVKTLDAEQKAGRIQTRSEAVEVATMVRPADRARQTSRMDCAPYSRRSRTTASWVSTAGRTATIC
jgi:predicted lysophospholipase L1 biosynthesis ABC-type transport system permease subunit